MNNKIQAYYGEYSLDHWLTLIKTGNLTLPPYQREFVWEKKFIQELAKSFNDGLFISPVIIARLKKQDGSFENIVLDGQQRLTSIVLLKENKFPKNKENTLWESYDKLKDANDYKDEKYEKYGNLDLKKHFLGFSYIFYSESDVQKQEKCFAEIFHKINSLGTALNHYQRVEALKYIFHSCQNIFASNKNKDCFPKFNLIRLLVFLILYKNSLENEGLEYIKKKIKSYQNMNSNSVVIKENTFNQLEYDLMYEIGREESDSDSDTFGKLEKNNITINKLNNKLNVLIEKQKKLKDLIGVQNKTGSDSINLNLIVTSDLYLFGLVNQVVIEDRDEAELNITTDTFQQLDNLITEQDNDGGSKKQPNTLDKIYKRIEDSIDFWNQVFPKPKP